MRSSNQALPGNYDLKKGNSISITNENDETLSDSFIRFEERREKFIWAHPAEIYFVKSADHYVRSLIKQGKEKKWMSKHSTLKELLAILPVRNFIRLNKFYLLNLDYFSHIDHTNRVLFFNDNSSIAIPHRISPFLYHLLKSSYT
jgi:DNA-binding LytR/AlgR family response regulator